MRRYFLARSQRTVFICWTVQYLRSWVWRLWVICMPLTMEPPVSWDSQVKPPTAKLPQLNSEMTQQVFRKFRTDWHMFPKMANFPTAQTNIQLYNCTYKAVYNSIINTYPEFFNMNQNKLLDMLEVLAMQKSNLMVHRISFSSTVQSDNESVQNYLIQQQLRAWDSQIHMP